MNTPQHLRLTMTRTGRGTNIIDWQDGQLVFMHHPQTDYAATIAHAESAQRMAHYQAAQTLPAPPPYDKRLHLLGYHAWLTESQPGADDWAQFASSLDALGIWEWHPHYADVPEHNAAMLIETLRWRIEIEWDGQAIVSEGDWAFPTLFEPFCRVVSDLCGERFSLLSQSEILNHTHIPLTYIQVQKDVPLLPDVLRFLEVDSHTWQGFSVEWQAEQLFIFEGYLPQGDAFFEHWTPEQRLQFYHARDARILAPDDEAWQQFWASLQALGVWRWGWHYGVARPKSPERWALDVKHNGIRRTTSGDFVLNPPLFKPFARVLRQLVSDEETR